MFISNLYPNEFIIDESNSYAYAPQDSRCGLQLPDVKPGLSEGFRASTRKKYPRSEWVDRVKEREKRGRTLSSIIRKKRIPTSDQDGTNYCWTYGVVSAIVAKRAWRGLPYVEFSRESVAAPIKGYRNNGGWGREALEFISKYGIMPQELWPQHFYSSSKYRTEANLAVALNYRVLESEILPDWDFDALFCANLDDEAVAVGYDWWSHEVCAVDPVVIGNNAFGVRIWNSWSDSYGDYGMAILSESKATPADAVIPYTFVVE